MQIYVDLSLSRSYLTDTIEHAGTQADPFSWSDVKKYLIAAATDGFDDGSELDSGRTLDGDGFAVEFLCFGTGDVISDADKLNISNVHFSESSHIIKFTGTKLRKYGIPVIKPHTSGISGTWIGISNTSNLVFDFDGFIVDVDQTAPFTLLGFAASANPTFRVQNNVVLGRGASNFKLFNSNNSDYPKYAVCKNTIMLNSSTANDTTLFSTEGSQLSPKALIAANYVAKHADMTNSVTFVDMSNIELTTSGNRFAYSGSFNDYVGASSRTSISSDNTLSYATQGVFNDTLFGGSVAYTNMQYDSFHPIHRGRLLEASNSLSVTYGTLVQDIIGNPIGQKIDAGAFQKHTFGNTIDVHVDLASSSHDGTKSGDETSPLPLADFLRDYARRAPVFRNVRYILRNENTTPISTLDLGPISTNTEAPDRSYSGIGSIEITSYKKHSLKQAVLSVNKIKPNAKLNVTFDNVRFLWSSGDDWIKTGEVSNQGYTLGLDRCVLKTTTLCTQSIVDQASGTCNIRISGSTLMVNNLEANVDASGLFINGVGTNFDCILSIIHTPSINIGQSAGTANLIGCYINGVAGLSFSGATLFDVRVNTTNLDDVFVDHDNSDYRAANYRLVSIPGNAHEITTPTALAPWMMFVERDARGLRRDESPYGSNLFDAGAYEYGYLKPQKQLIYVDLNRFGLNHTGKQFDKYGIEDLRAKLAQISNSTLDAHYEFVMTGYAYESKLVLENVEATDVGLIVLRSDNPNSPCTLNAGSSILTLDSCTNLNVLVDGVILRSEDVEPSVTLMSTSGTEDSTLHINRSILWKRQRAYFMFDSNSFPLSSSFTCGAYTVVLGTDWEIGSTITDTLRNIVAAFEASVGFIYDYDCYLDGTKLGFVSKTLDSCALSTTTSVEMFGNAVDSTSIDVAIGWNVVGFGTTIAETFDNGVERPTVGITHAASSSGLYQAVAFQGSTGLSQECVVGDTSVTLLDCRYAGYIAPSGCTTTNVSSETTLLSSLYNDTNVVVNNFALLAGYDVANMSDIENKGYIFDCAVDIVGSFRSEKFALGNDKSDVGAIEFNKLATNQGFSGNVSDPTISLTPAGVELNIRHDIDGLAFKIVGYALHNEGYLYWQPNKVAPIENYGAQAIAHVELTANTFSSGDNVTVDIDMTSLIVQYNTVGGFVAGSDTRATAKNIASSLNADETFRNNCYVVLTDVGFDILAKRFGVYGNDFTLATTGASFASTSFSGGVDPTFSNRVWPETSEYAAFERIESPDVSSKSFVVRLDKNQANYPIGELLVIAEILDSPVPTDIGLKVVYATARFGLHSKHSREILVKRFIFQF